MNTQSQPLLKSAFQLLSLSAVTIAIFACSSNKNDMLAVEDIEPMPVSDSKLINASSANFATVLQNGLYLNATSHHYNRSCQSCEMTATVADESSAGTADTGFSVTTTQEQGVGESDRVKYDGKTMFIANNGTLPYHWLSTEANVNDKPAFVRVLTKNSDDSLSEVSLIDTDENVGDFSDLYLNDGKLAMIYNIHESQTQGEDGEAISTDALTYYRYDDYLGINFQDVSDPSAPSLMAKFKIDGYLLSSRRIDNQVHIVSSYTPQLPEAVPLSSNASETELQLFYSEIVATDLTEFLPKVYKQDGSTELLVTQEQCFVPDDLKIEHGYANITTVTTFDLNDPGNFQSRCILAPLQGIYSSIDNLYLHGSLYDEVSETNKTVIHKFGYQQNTVNYQASGAIQGHTSWNNPHLRFSEHNDLLRVMTSDWSWNADGRTNVHRLFILQDNNQGELKALAQLPNDDRPEAIGKPDEDIFAARYFADKVYVVTFRRTDPLYVLDLSDPMDPFIEGELEIPGYSSFLQPLNERFVLGIGQQIDPNAAGGLTPVNEPNSEFIEGAKAELYDVSDPKSPVVAATLVYEGVYSAAEWDYHALTQLKVADDKFKFAFPLGGWTEIQNEDGSLNWNYNQAMQLIEVDTSSAGELTNVGTLSPESEYYGQWGDRAVLHNDVVYYIRNDKVYQSFWSLPSTLNGPF